MIPSKLNISFETQSFVLNRMLDVRNVWYSSRSKGSSLQISPWTKLTKTCPNQRAADDDIFYQFSSGPLPLPSPRNLDISIWAQQLVQVITSLMKPVNSISTIDRLFSVFDYARCNRNRTTMNTSNKTAIANTFYDWKVKSSSKLVFCFKSASFTNLKKKLKDMMWEVCWK